MSFVPSLYVRDDNYGLIPSDEQYVDSAAGPTMAIGRIPATTAAGVKVVVTKTLVVLQHPPASHSAVFASGKEDSIFQQSSEQLAALLPAMYSQSTANAQTVGSKEARRSLLQDINSGVSLVNYVGHGNLEQWDVPPAMLTVDDVPKLTNASPSVFLGWGCQTAYLVDPTDQALNARLLLAEHGAFLTLGSTGLDLADPQTALARALFNELFHDPAISTFGQALQVAETKVLPQSGTRPVIDSYELFGDPEVPISVLNG